MSIGQQQTRRRFLASATATAGAMTLLSSSWAADAADPRVSQLVAKTIGIDTHNHIDVPSTAAELPGPDIDLASKLKCSGLFTICATFATDYQLGDAYKRFLKGMVALDHELQRNGLQRSLTAEAVSPAHQIAKMGGANYLRIFGQSAG